VLYSALYIEVFSRKGHEEHKEGLQILRLIDLCPGGRYYAGAIEYITTIQVKQILEKIYQGKFYTPDKEFGAADLCIYRKGL
jgi:hypothetical protein